jgi:hypothetical protein
LKRIHSSLALDLAANIVDGAIEAVHHAGFATEPATPNPEWLAAGL